ncbi:MAG: ATP-binding protein [Solirubrobacterales bacterium]|nr:ATP-binding protein [Solirubrobacterales bacterium]
MDARINPYAPGAGTRPPLIAGRDSEIQAYEVLLDRLKRGTAGQSMIITGLRGVGKTVLLNALEDISVERGWIAAGLELDEGTSFPVAIARSAKRILGELQPTRKVAAQVRQAFGRLGSFTLKEPNGFELTYTPSPEPSSETLGEDFADLLLALGQAAQSKGSGVAFLLDEVQFVPAKEFGPFVVGLHRLNQKALPVTCVAAGLPSLPALVGNAKSYAERLFEYPRIDQLKRSDALHALASPASKLDVIWEPDALDYVFSQTAGYPYFLQQYGKYAWDVASDGRITKVDAQAGGRIAQDRLDDGFFKVRYEGRATKAERAFLHAMANCQGPPYGIAEVTTALGKSDQRSISVRRNALIRKGLIYAPEHGAVDYTVPHFAAYLRRQDAS